MLKDIITKNRSCRRFDESFHIDRKTLLELVELARLAPSGANLQPLKYFLSCETDTNAIIFEQLGWAGYLKDWQGPAEGERPAAYIIIVGDTEIAKNFGCDHGIAAQNIVLGATEKGLAACMVGTIKRNELAKLLNIGNRYEILLVIALGKPNEHIVIEDAGAGGDIKYWRDEKNVHHVPKRRLENIIIG